MARANLIGVTFAGLLVGGCVGATLDTIGTAGESLFNIEPYTTQGQDMAIMYYEKYQAGKITEEDFKSYDSFAADCYDVMNETGEELTKVMNRMSISQQMRCAEMAASGELDERWFKMAEVIGYYDDVELPKE